MCLFPKPPKAPEKPADPPRSIDPGVLDARKTAKRQALAARGQQSTILTGASGLTNPATTATKTLLG